LRILIKSFSHAFSFNALYNASQYQDPIAECRNDPYRFTVENDRNISVKTGTLFLLFERRLNPSTNVSVVLAKPVNEPLHAIYSEKLLVGYRWYDAKSVSPLFPFGHGLSYTTFQYSNLQIFGRLVAVDIMNNGLVSGAEVVQLYVQYPASAGEPPKVLRGFQKVRLLASEKRTLAFTLSDEDLSIWDQSRSDCKTAVSAAVIATTACAKLDYRTTAAYPTALYSTCYVSV